MTIGFFQHLPNSIRFAGVGTRLSHTVPERKVTIPEKFFQEAGIDPEKLSPPAQRAPNCTDKFILYLSAPHLANLATAINNCRLSETPASVQKLKTEIREILQFLISQKYPPEPASDEEAPENW